MLIWQHFITLVVRTYRGSSEMKCPVSVTKKVNSLSHLKLNLTNNVDNSKCEIKTYAEATMPFDLASTSS